MKIHIDTNGYPGDADKRLKYMSKGPVDGIITEEFLQKHTKFKNVVELFKSLNCDLSPSLFEDLKSGKYDEAIQQQTEFHSWEDLVKQATQENLKKQ